MENTKQNNPYVHPIQENTLTRYAGMTLRDYLAAKAMQAMISNHYMFDSLHTDANELCAKCSFELSDAMLKQREL